MANLQKKNKKIHMRQFGIINMSHLAETSEISYNVLYNNFAGIYPKITLSANERTILANTVEAEMKRFLDVLGFEMSLKRKV